jgi:hypothetical protein
MSISEIGIVSKDLLEEFSLQSLRLGARIASTSSYLKSAPIFSALSLPFIYNQVGIIALLTNDTALRLWRKRHMMRRDEPFLPQNFRWNAMLEEVFK